LEHWTHTGKAVPDTRSTCICWNDCSKTANF